MPYPAGYDTSFGIICLAILATCVIDFSLFKFNEVKGQPNNSNYCRKSYDILCIDPSLYRFACRRSMNKPAHYSKFLFHPPKKSNRVHLTKTKLSSFKQKAESSGSVGINHHPFLLVPHLFNNS